MKKILFITAFVPSRISAGENFSRQLINELADFYKIDLIFFKYPTDNDYVIENNNVRVIKIFKNNKIIKFINFILFPFIFPLFSVRFNLHRLFVLKRIINSEIYEAIIFDFSQTFLFSKFIRHKKIILNCHDIIAQRYSRIYFGIFTWVVKKSESYLFRNINAKVFCHSNKDKVLLNKFYGVLAEVTSLFIEKHILDTWPSQVGDYFVLFGNWKRKDNSDGLEWFLGNVMPNLKQNVKIKIIGSGLKHRILEEIKRYSNIEYLGFLDNPYVIISNALALLSPLFTGAGIKVKVMDSLACGTCVIGTDISFEGIPEALNSSLILSNTANEFIENISKFRTSLPEKIKIKEKFLNLELSNTIKKYLNNQA